jgi:hypothetical protein
VRHRRIATLAAEDHVIETFQRVAVLAHRVGFLP